MMDNDRKNRWNLIIILLIVNRLTNPTVISAEHIADRMENQNQHRIASSLTNNARDSSTPFLNLFQMIRGFPVTIKHQSQFRTKHTPTKTGTLRASSISHRNSVHDEKRRNHNLIANKFEPQRRRRTKPKTFRLLTDTNHRKVRRHPHIEPDRMKLSELHTQPTQVRRRNPRRRIFYPFNEDIRQQNDNRRQQLQKPRSQNSRNNPKQQTFTVLRTARKHSGESNSRPKSIYKDNTPSNTKRLSVKDMIEINKDGTKKFVGIFGVSGMRIKEKPRKTASFFPRLRKEPIDKHLNRGTQNTFYKRQHNDVLQDTKSSPMFLVTELQPFSSSERQIPDRSRSTKHKMKIHSQPTKYTLHTFKPSNIQRHELRHSAATEIKQVQQHNQRQSKLDNGLTNKDKKGSAMKIMSAQLSVSGDSFRTKKPKAVKMVSLNSNNNEQAYAYQPEMASDESQSSLRSTFNTKHSKKPDTPLNVTWIGKIVRNEALTKPIASVVDIDKGTKDVFASQKRTSSRQNKNIDNGHFSNKQQTEGRIRSNSKSKQNKIDEERQNIIRNYRKYKELYASVMQSSKPRSSQTMTKKRTTSLKTRSISSTTPSTRRAPTTTTYSTTTTHPTTTTRPTTTTPPTTTTHPTTTTQPTTTTHPTTTTQSIITTHLIASTTVTHPTTTQSMMIEKKVPSTKNTTTTTSTTMAHSTTIKTTISTSTKPTLSTSQITTTKTKLSTPNSTTTKSTLSPPMTTMKKKVISLTPTIAKTSTSMPTKTTMKTTLSKRPTETSTTTTTTTIISPTTAEPITQTTTAKPLTQTTTAKTETQQPSRKTTMESTTLTPMQTKPSTTSSILLPKTINTRSPRRPKSGIIEAKYQTTAMNTSGTTEIEPGESSVQDTTFTSDTNLTLEVQGTKTKYTKKQLQSNTINKSKHVDMGDNNIPSTIKVDTISVKSLKSHLQIKTNSKEGVINNTSQTKHTSSKQIGPNTVSVSSPSIKTDIDSTAKQKENDDEINELKRLIQIEPGIFNASSIENINGSNSLGLKKGSMPNKTNKQTNNLNINTSFTTKEEYPILSTHATEIRTSDEIVFEHGVKQNKVHSKKNTNLLVLNNGYSTRIPIDDAKSIHDKQSSVKTSYKRIQSSNLTTFLGKNESTVLEIKKPPLIYDESSITSTFLKHNPNVNEISKIKSRGLIEPIVSSATTENNYDIKSMSTFTTTRPQGLINTIGKGDGGSFLKINTGTHNSKVMEKITKEKENQMVRSHKKYMATSVKSSKQDSNDNYRETPNSIHKTRQAQHTKQLYYSHKAMPLVRRKSDIGIIEVNGGRKDKPLLDMDGNHFIDTTNRNYDEKSDTGHIQEKRFNKYHSQRPNKQSSPIRKVGKDTKNRETPDKIDPVVHTSITKDGYSNSNKNDRKKSYDTALSSTHKIVKISKQLQNYLDLNNKQQSWKNKQSEMITKGNKQKSVLDIKNYQGKCNTSSELDSILKAINTLQELIKRVKNVPELQPLVSDGPKQKYMLVPIGETKPDLELIQRAYDAFVHIEDRTSRDSKYT